MSTVEDGREIELNVDLYRAFKEALAVQDACNLTGIVHTFDRVVGLVRADLGRFDWRSTPTLAMHPIAVLFASKLHDLCRLGLSDPRRYGLAWEFADAVAKGAWLVGSEPYRAAMTEYLVDFYND